MSEGSNGNMRGGKREEDCSNKLEEKKFRKDLAVFNRILT